MSKDGDIYSGFATNFIPQGHGIMQYKNKDVYTGQFEDGKRNGEGMFISADGREEYIGQWMNDKIAPLVAVGKDNDVVSRITDLTQVLLQNEKNTEDSCKDASYHKQLDLLQKIVDQSLSQSLMHLDNDVSINKTDKYASTMWISKSDSSQYDSDCTEAFTDTTAEDDTKESRQVTEENGRDHSNENKAIQLKANLLNYPNGDTYLGTLCKETKQREGYGGK